jgi:hypothetical protein
MVCTRKWRSVRASGSKVRLVATVAHELLSVDGA